MKKQSNNSPNHNKGSDQNQSATPLSDNSQPDNQKHNQRQRPAIELMNGCKTHSNNSPSHNRGSEQKQSATTLTDDSQPDNKKISQKQAAKNDPMNEHYMQSYNSSNHNLPDFVSSTTHTEAEVSDPSTNVIYIDHDESIVSDSDGAVTPVKPENHIERSFLESTSLLTDRWKDWEQQGARPKSI